MQVGAVVKLAVLGMCLDIGHESAQPHGFDVMQTKLLKAWRVNQSGGSRFIYPVKRGAGGGVFP